MELLGTWWMWSGFAVLVITLLLVDLLLVGGGKQHKVSLKEAAIWSLVWIGVALAFNGAIWWYLDAQAGRELANQKALEFFTGYLIEKALAVDNVFVWLMLFGYFAVPAELQRRVLLYGVLGAILMRTGMIFGGSWLISQFHWVLYLFGAFLVLTGGKMLWMADKEPDLANNPLLKWLRRHLKVTEHLEDEKFFVIKQGVRYATPLFLVLILVEISDVIFAVDSIPAIFAITTDPFIVLTSNIFAIMGLRAMYFLLADFADRFVLLKYGLALILLFIGTKMLLIDIYKIPIAVSLGVVAVILIGSMLLSLRYSRKSPSA
ncbi:TerC family protein [Pseudaeromonas pectinilytica]|jgi:TerC family integral membrane protein